MRRDFYVHIVESPSPEELLNGITEGRALCSFLDTAGIKYLYNLAVDPTQFDIAMTKRVVEASSKFQLMPILHLSTHGGEHGIQLTSQHESESGQLIGWSQLAKYILKIRQTFDEIGVCMSCCEGANGVKMAEVFRKQEIPFTWLIGTSTKIRVIDAALAFAVFYRRVHCKDLDRHNLLNAMRAASGVPDFNVWFGDLTQEQYAYNSGVGRMASL